jgi:hypothetical protein
LDTVSRTGEVAAEESHMDKADLLSQPESLAY